MSITFGILSFHTKCKNFIYILSLFRSVDCAKAFSLAEEYLLRHLLEQNLQNLQVGLPSLIILLKDDRLNARCEELVWEAIKSWIEKEKDERADSLEQLIKCLRINLLSEEYFKNDVKKT
jgi:hypothetical protein